MTATATPPYSKARGLFIVIVCLFLCLGPAALVPDHTSATPNQAVIGMPFSGKWAYNTLVSPPYTDVNSSHPSVHHHPGGGDWATDIYAPEGTPVKLNVPVVTGGALSFSWKSTSTSCGQSTGVNIIVNGATVGWLYYAHLNNAVTSGAISNGMQLGTVHDWGGCNPGVHVHTEFKNTTNYSCYVDNGQPGVTLSYGAAFAVLGSSNTGAQQACGSVPTGGTTGSGSDFNTDNQDDIAWLQTPNLYMLNATGYGTFGINGPSGGFGTPDWVGSGTNDSTGTPEVYWHQGSTLYTLEWQGSGWSIVTGTNNIGTPDAAAVGDYNHDGLDDIAWHQGTTLYMLNALGNGKFGIAGYNGGFNTPDWTGAGINNGSHVDEVYWHQGSTIYTVTWQTASNSWSIAHTTNGIGTPDAAVVGDFNNDGYTDIAWHQGSTLYMLNATNWGTFGIAGSSGGIGTPDWSGGGINNGSNKAQVYWHQGSTIFDLSWQPGSSSWSIAASTGGITTPDAATSSNPL